jgi:excisionase family DNA binding protein
MQDPDFVFSGSETVAEFCRREKISKNLAYRMIREGRLPVYRLSPRNTRIDLTKLHAELSAGDRPVSSKESGK